MPGSGARAPGDHAVDEVSIAADRSLARGGAVREVRRIEVKSASQQRVDAHVRAFEHRRAVDV